MANKDINTQLLLGFKGLQTEYLDDYKSSLKSTMANFWLSDLDNLNIKLKQENPSAPYKATLKKDSSGMPIIGSNGLPEVVITDGIQVICSGNQIASSSFLTQGEKNQIAIYENFAEEHAKSTEKLYTIADNALRQGKFDEDAIRGDLDKIFTGTGSSKQGSEAQRKNTIIEDNIKRLQILQNNYQKAQTNYIKAQTKAGEVAPFTSKISKIDSRFSNSKAKPNKTVGVTSINSKADTFILNDNLNIDNMPKMPTKTYVQQAQTKRLNTQLSIQRSSLPSAQGTRKVFYDTETFGDLGNKNFGVAQYTFRWGKGADQQYSAIVKQEKETAKLIRDTVSKLERGEKLNAVEERTAKWLLDYDFEVSDQKAKNGKQIATITTSHNRRNAYNIYSDEILNQIKKGAIALTSDNYEFTNRTTNAKVLKELQRLKIVNGNQISSNNLLIGQNNENFDDRVLKQALEIAVKDRSFDMLTYIKENYQHGTIRKGKNGAKVLLGYQNEELADFFDIDLKKAAEEWYKTYKPGEEFTDKVYEGLQHLSDWDTIITEEVYKAAEKDAQKKATKLAQQGQLSTVIRQGYKAIAVRSEDRKNQGDYLTDVNDNNKLMDGKTNKYDNRLFRSGAIYSFKGTKKLGNNLYEAVYHDEERNIDIHVSGTKNEIAKRNKQTFGVEGWKTSSEFDKLYSTEDRVINQIFDDFYGLKQQVGLAQGKVSKVGAKHSGRYAVAKNFVDKNKAELEKIVSAIDKENFTSLQKDMAVKMIAQKTGLYSLKGLTPSEMHNYITANTDSRFNSYINAYQTFMKEYEWVFQTTKEGRAYYKDITQAIGILQQNGSEQMMQTQGNLFYGLGKFISEGFQKFLPEGMASAQHTVNFDNTKVETAIDTSLKAIKSFVASEKGNVSKQLYDNAIENGRLQQNLDGRADTKRRSASNLPTNTKLNKTNKDTLSGKIKTLQDITKKKGIAMTVVPSQDESNLTFYFYDERRAKDVLKVQNGEITVNGDNASSFVLPLVSDQGVMSNNGMNIVNTFTINSQWVGGGAGHKNGGQLDFTLTTTQDKIVDNLIRQFDKKEPITELETNDPFRKATVSELIKSGDTVSAERSLNYLKKLMIEGSANVDTYKQMEEANDQIKESGSLEEKYIRAHTLDFSDALHTIFKTVTGSDMDNFVLNGKSIYGTDIFNNMLSYLMMTNKGEGSFLKGALGELFEEGGEGSTNYGEQIESYIEKLASILPEMDFTPTKEATLTTAGRGHFASPRNFRPFATINSESKRASAQVYHTLEKTLNATDLGDKTAVEVLNSIFGQNIANKDIQRGNKYRRRIIESDTLSDLLDFANITKEEYLDRAENYQYNIKGTNDLKIKEAVESELKNLEEIKANGGKLSRADSEYYKQLKIYEKDLPSVYEGTILTRQSESEMFDSMRKNVSKELDLQYVSDDFLDLISVDPNHKIDRNILAQMLGEEGSKLDLSNTKIAKSIMAMGKSMQERHALKLNTGDKLNAIVSQDGKLRLIYDQNQKMKSGSRMLLDAYGRTTNMSIPDRLFEAIVGNKSGSRSDVDILQENSAIKTVNMAEQIGGRYEYLFDLLQKLGYSNEDINKALEDTTGAKQYIKYKDGQFVTVGRRIKGKNGHFVFADDKGNLILQNEEDMKAFANPFKEETDWDKIKSFDDLKIDKNSDIGKILNKFGYFGKSQKGQILRDLYDPFTLRMGVGLANEYEYTGAIGIGSQDFYDLNSRHKIGLKEAESIFRGIADAEEEASPEEYKAFSNLREKMQEFAYGDEAKIDANGNIVLDKNAKVKRLENRKEGILNALRTTFGAISLNNKIQDIDFSSFSREGWADLIYGEGGGVDKGIWDNSAYGKLLQQSGNNRYASIKLSKEMQNLFAIGNPERQGEEVSLNEIVISMFDPDKMGKNQYVVSDYVKKANSMLRALQKFENGEIEQDVAQEYVSAFLSHAYHDTVHKEGSLAKQLSGVRRGSGFFGTVEGLNLAGYNEAMENSVVIGENNLRTMLGINFNPNSQEYGKALDNLRYQYGSLINIKDETKLKETLTKKLKNKLEKKYRQDNGLNAKDKIEDKVMQEITTKVENMYNKDYDNLSKEEQTMEEELLKDLTVEALDVEGGGKALSFYFNRYPSTNMLSMRAVNLRVNKNIKDNFMKVAPGLEKFVNADHDSDKGYLINPLLTTTVKDYKDYKEASEQLNKVVATQTKSLQDLGNVMVADVLKGYDANAETIFKAYSKVYDSLTPEGISNDILTSLIAKTNFAKVGSFSNLNTSVRSLLDSTNLGNRAQDSKILTASTFVSHFLEFLEQDAISAKKVGDRLKFTNHEGQEINNSKFNKIDKNEANEEKEYDQRRRAVFKSLDNIKSLITQPLYQLKETAKVNNMSTAEYKWTQVVDKMLEEGLLSEDNGIVFGKGKRHFDMAFSILNNRKIKGKNITFDNPELLNEQGLTKEGLIQQFVIMEDQIEKNISGTDLITYATNYYNEGQKQATYKNLVKRMRDYDLGVQQGRYGSRRKELLANHEIEKDKKGNIVLNEQGLPAIKGLDDKGKLEVHSFLAQLMDPDGKHEYITDSSYQNSLEELKEMYQYANAESIQKHKLNKGSARIGKVLINGKPQDIFSVTSLIDKMVRPFARDYKDEMSDLAKAAIEAVDTLGEGENWTKWNLSDNQDLVRYANAMNSSDKSSLISKIKMFYLPTNRGSLQHEIFDRLNKKINTDNNKDHAQITQQDIEDIFSNEDVKAKIAKVNLQGEKLGIKDILDEKELKAVTEAYANYINKNDINRTLSSETSLGFSIKTGKNDFLNIVGTADMITATGIRDYKYKGAVHGDLESWQLSLLNRAVLSEIERSYAIDSENYSNKQGRLSSGNFTLGKHHNLEGDYLTDAEVKRLKSINGVFEQGVLSRYTEKKGKNWYAKEGSRKGLFKDFYNMIMNPENYQQRKIAPELIINHLGTTTDSTGKKVGWIKEINFDQISDKAMKPLMLLFKESLGTHNDNERAVIAAKMQSIIDLDRKEDKINTMRDFRLFGPNGKLTGSLDDIKNSLGLEDLDEEERAKKIWDILNNGTSTNKKALLSNAELMERFGLKAIDSNMDARSKEFKDIVALVQNIGKYGEESITSSDILEKYRLEGAKFGTDFIEHAKVEGNVDLTSYSDILNSESKPIEVLKAFMKMDEGLQPEELKERAAFFDKEAKYLEGSAFTGEKKSIDLKKMSDNYLFDENGNPKENVDKTNIYSLLHTHTSGGILPSIQDIEAMKIFAKDGYDNLKILQVGDNLGHLLSLDLSNIADYDNFIENYQTWLNNLKGELKDKLPEGVNIEDVLEEKDGKVVGIKDGFSLFDSEEGRVISESLFNQMSKLLGSEDFTVTNSEGKLLQLARSQDNGEQENLQFKLVTNSEGKSLWAAQGAETFEAVIAGDENASKSFEETNKIVSEVAEGIGDFGENTTKAFEKIKDVLGELDEETGDILDENFEKDSDTGQIKHKNGNKAGQNIDAEDLNNIVKNAEERFVNKKVNETLNTEVKNATNYSNGLELVDVNARKVKLKDLYSQMQEAIQRNDLSEIGRLNEEYKQARAHYAEGYASITGTTYTDYSAEKDIKKEYEAEQKAANSKIQEIIGQYEALNSMLQQNAPTNYLNSMLKDLQKNLDVLQAMGKSSDEIFEHMTEEGKAKLIKSNLDNYNNLLNQDRQIDFERYQLEQITTSDHLIGANTKKQFILNPYKNQVMTAKANMLDLQASGVQANLSLQEDIAKASNNEDLAKQYEERKRFNEEYKETNRLYLDTAKDAQKGSIAVENLATQAKGMLKTALQYGVVYRGVQSLIAQVYTIIGSIKEFDTLETQLRLTKTMNKETAASMIKDYKAVADELGTTTQAVTTASVTFLRQGRSISDTNTLIRQSAILAKVGFMEEKDSAELLTATLNGFKLEAKDAASVVDLVAYTDTIAATSAQELMTAFQYVASSASVAGIEVNKLNAMIATSSEVTRLSASTIGQAYKTMISRLQQVKVGSLIDSESGEDLSNVDKMLKQYGIHIMDNNNKMKEGDQILEEFAEKWKSWGNDTAKKREAIEALAGTRQGNIAMSLFDNWDRYEEILADTNQNAEGSASEKMKASTESINTSIARLQNTLKDFASSSGAVGMFKWVVDLTTGVAGLSKGLGALALLYLVIGKNGAALNAVYNIQIGLVDKLKTSFQSLFQKQELQKKQALTSLSNANIKTISGGGVTAFVDPVTGKPSEPIDNALASRTLAFNAEANFQKNMQDLGKFDNSEAAKGLREKALKGQLALQRARVNGSIEKGSIFTENLKRWTDEAVVNGSMSEAERNQVYANAGKLADMGQLNNTTLNKYLLGKNEQGQIISKVSEENTAELTKNHNEYLEEHPEALMNQEEALVKTMGELIAAIRDNTAAIEGKENIKGKRNTEGVHSQNKVDNNTNTKEVSTNENVEATGSNNPKTRLEEIKEQLAQKDKNGNYIVQGKKRGALWREHNIEENKEKLAQNNVTGREKYLLERRNKAIENTATQENIRSTENTSKVETNTENVGNNENTEVENIAVPKFLQPSTNIEDKSVKVKKSYHIRKIGKSKHEKEVQPFEERQADRAQQREAIDEEINKLQGTIKKTQERTSSKNPKTKQRAENKLPQLKKDLDELEKQRQNIFNEATQDIEEQKTRKKRRIKGSWHKKGQDNDEDFIWNKKAMPKNQNEENNAVPNFLRNSTQANDTKNNAEKEVETNNQKVEENNQQNANEITEENNKPRRRIRGYRSSNNQYSTRQNSMRQTTSTTQPVLDATNDPNAPKPPENQSALRQYYDKHQRGITSIAGTIGMIGGSMGASQLASDLGASSSTASMVGMGTGIASQILATQGMWGAVASAGIGAVGAIYKVIKDHNEKIKENIRQTFNEAKEGFNNATQKLRELKDTDLQSTFKELAQGVDNMGRNVSLTKEQYEKYQEIVKKLTDGHQELIDTTDEEGNVYADKNNLLQRSIELLKEQIALEKEKMYSSKTVQQQLEDNAEERRTARKTYKQRENDRKVSEGDYNSDLFDIYNKAKNKGIDVSWISELLSSGKDISGVIKLGNWKSKLRKIAIDIPDLSKQIEGIITASENEEIFRTEYNKLRSQAYDVLKGWMSTQDVYKNASDKEKAVYDKIISNTDLDDSGSEKSVNEAKNNIMKNISGIGNSSAKGSILDYLFNTNKTVAQKKEQRKGIFDILKTQMKGGAKAAYEFLQNIGIIESKAEYTDNEEELNKRINHDATVASIKQKIDKDNTIKGQKNKDKAKADLETLDEDTLNEINNNFMSIVVDNFTEGISSMGEAVKKWKDNATSTILEQINISDLTKYAGGFKTLRDMVAEFRSNAFKNEKGQYEFNLTAEQFKALKEEIQKPFNLTDEQISSALSDGKGGLTLGEKQVEQLAYTMLVESLKNKDFNIETLNAYDQNLRAMGINSGKNIGYTQYAKYLMQQGIADISNGQLVAKTGHNFNADQGKMVDAINASGILQNKNVLRDITNSKDLYNVDKFLEDIGITGDSFNELAESVKNTISALGGMQGVINSLATGDLFKTENLPGLLKHVQTGNTSEVAEYVKGITGNNFEGLTDTALTEVTFRALKLKRDEAQAQLDLLNSGNLGISDAYKKGLEDQGKEAKKSLRNAQRSLDDLKKEAKLDEINLLINKMQNNFDKLAKTIQSCASAMEMLDNQDFENKLALTNNQLNNTEKYTLSLNEGWNNLLQQYEKATTGEEAQAIGEQLSKISDQMTENLKQRLILQKQISKIYLDRINNQITNTEDTYGREKNILQRQSEAARSNGVQFVNMTALSNPNNFLSNMSKDEFQKAQDLSKKLLQEENSRQEKLNAIKADYLQRIYEVAQQRRKEDIADAEEEVEKLRLKVTNISEQLSGDIHKQMIGDLKKLLEEIDSILESHNFPNAAITIKGEVQAEKANSRLSVQEFVEKESLEENIKKATSRNPVSIGQINKLSQLEAKEKGIDNVIEAQNLRMSNIDKYHKGIKGGAKAGHRLLGKDLAEKNSINVGEKNLTVLKVGEGGYIFNPHTNSLGFITGTQEDGTAIIKMDDGKIRNYSYADLMQMGYHSLKEIKQSNAYATSKTQIANGPITVGEKTPEFVMFKNGKGAIFDKTTVLNGTDVDFVSNASYANQGKNNGVFVTSPYAYGGGEDNIVKKTKETAKKVSENTNNITSNVTDTSSYVQENIEEVNKQITTDITDNNEAIIDTVAQSWKTNKKNTNDSLWETKSITKQSLKEIVELFKSAFSDIRNAGYEYTGNLGNQFDEFIQKYSKEYNVPEAIVNAIIETESNGNPFAKSGAGAKGLMQLMDNTAKTYGVTNSYDPEQNIKAGTHYLADLYKQYNGDWTKVFGHYNGGTRGATNPVAETRNYISKVKSLSGMGGSNKRINNTTNVTSVNNHSVTSPYNVSRNIKGRTGIHKGIDLAYNYEPIYANKDLTITYAGNVAGFGKAVYAQDSDGYTYIFGHLDSINVKTNQKVKAGTKLGVTGNSGRSTGPHLHYQVEKNGTTINPSSKPYAFKNSGTQNIGGIGGDEFDATEAKQRYQDYAEHPENIVTSQFVTADFALTQRQSYVRNIDEAATVKDILKGALGNLGSAATWAKDLQDFIIDDSNMRITKSKVEALKEYEQALQQMNEELQKAKEAGVTDSEFYKEWYAAYDKVSENIKNINDSIAQQVQDTIENFKNSMDYAFSYIDSIRAKVENTLAHLDNQINKLRDYQTIDKATSAMEKYFLIANKWNTAGNKKSAIDTQSSQLRNDIVSAFMSLGLDPSKQNDLIKRLGNLVRDNGEVDVATQQDLNNFATYLSQQPNTLISSEEATQTSRIISEKLGELIQLGGDAYNVEQDMLSIDQERNTALWDMITQNEAHITQAKEERYSIYNAIVNNSEYLKQLVNMQGQLIKDTNVRGKTINKLDEYDKLMDVIRSQFRTHNAQTTDIEDFIDSFNGNFSGTGINAQNWFDSQGNLITEIFNKDKAYLEKLYMGQTVDRNDKIGTSFANNDKVVGLGTAKIGAILGSMNTLGTLQQERAETLNNINSSMSDALSMQKDILEYQKQLLTTVKEELLSAVQSNSDRNSLIEGYLSKLSNVFDTFNRDQKYTVINSQLRNNQNERVNLIEHQNTLKNQRTDLREEINKITSDIDVDSLFTAKGERRADAYNEAQKTLDEMLSKGEISIGQQMTIKNNLDIIEDNLKEEVQINDNIIDNYNTENELINQKIALHKESYDWQISKMQALISLKEKQFETENKIFELRSDLDKELRSAKQTVQWLNKSERLRIFNEEDYTKLYAAIDEMEAKSSAYYNDYYSQMMNLTEDTLYKQEYITAEYQRRMDLVEAEYNLTQKRVDLEKQQMKLRNVLEEKNTRMYINGEWQYVANTEDVISSSEAVADAETAYKQVQQEKLQKIQEAQMSKYVDGLKEIQAALENSTKYTNSTEQELATYISQLVNSLTGGDLDTSSVKMSIDTLNSAIHDFTQRFDSEVNEDLLSSIQKIKRSLSNEFDQEYVEKLSGKLDSAITETSAQIRTLDSTVVEPLIKSLNKLILALEIKGESMNMEVSYNKTAYKDINDIVNAKLEYENASKQKANLTAQLNNGNLTEDEKQTITDQIDNLTKVMEQQNKLADKKRTSLVNQGYGDFAEYLSASNHGWKESNSLRAELEDTNEKYWRDVLDKYNNNIVSQEQYLREDRETREDISSQEQESTNNFNESTNNFGESTNSFKKDVEASQKNTTNFGEEVDVFGKHIEGLPTIMSDVFKGTISEIKSIISSSQAKSESSKSSSSSSWKQTGSNTFVSSNSTVNNAAKAASDYSNALKAANSSKKSSSTSKATAKSSIRTSYRPKKAAIGDISTTNDLYNIDEQGSELYIPSGRLKQMEYGDQIVPHNISENLLRWGTMNPYLINSGSPAYTSNITNTQHTSIDIQNINLSNVKDGNEFVPQLNRYLQRTNSLSKY